MGFTTRIAAGMFLDTINIPNTQSIIIAQDETNSLQLFQIIKRFYDYLPSHCKRIASTNNTTTLAWDDIGSYFSVSWAGSKNTGRGGTINNAHLSEVAFWENAGEIVSGLLQAVPPDGNIFIESTANGVANYYHDEYIAATNGESIYESRFFPWFLNPENRSSRLIRGEEFKPTDYEEKLIDRFDLDYEQLIWRRNKILELKNAYMAGKEVGTFEQEYPSTSEEAFLTTGSSVFNKKHLIENYFPKVAPPLDNFVVPNKYPFLARVRYQQQGRFEVWKKPEVGKRYLLTADPSEGLNDKGDHDYCCSSVIDADSFEQVAKLRGRWEPNEYAHLLAEIGWLYNTALIGVERNNHGHSVLNTLINDIGYEGLDGYGGVYHHIEYDAKGTKNSKPGYPTNVKTKGIALSALIELIDDESIIINSKQTLDEMLLYSKLPGNKFGASSGHDDSVMELAIGAAILKDAHFQKRKARANTRKTGSGPKGKFKGRKGVML